MQTSQDLSSGHSVAPSAKSSFNWIMKKLMSMVDGGPAFATLPNHVSHEASVDLLMSVRGCGIFAPAIALFLGKPVVKDVLQKLLASTTRVLDTSGASGRGVFGIAQRKVTQKAECLIAFASLVRQVCVCSCCLGRAGHKAYHLTVLTCRLAVQLPAADVDEVVLEQLQSVAGELVYDFASLHTYGRKVVCRSLSLLLSALHGKGAALASLLTQVTVPALVRTLSAADESMVRRLTVAAVPASSPPRCG